MRCMCMVLWVLTTNQTVYTTSPIHLFTVIFTLTINYVEEKKGSPSVTCHCPSQTTRCWQHHADKHWCPTTQIIALMSQQDNRYKLTSILKLEGPEMSNVEIHDCGCKTSQIKIQEKKPQWNALKITEQRHWRGADEKCHHWSSWTHSSGLSWVKLVKHFVHMSRHSLCSECN